MKKVALHTIGCKLNYAETAAIANLLIENGYQVVKIDEQKDILIINSCSVTSHAERECRQIIRRNLKKYPNEQVIIVGCYSQYQYDELSHIKGVDLILGLKEKFHLLEYLKTLGKTKKPEIHISSADALSDFEFASSINYGGRTRVFIKIQDGCDYRCAYCVIPLLRGRSRSMESNKIYDQVIKATEKGYKEVVLTGVNTGDYGKQKGESLFNLLKKLIKIDELKRLRISSIEPNMLTNELLEFWFEQEKLCKHWHIPMQSGSDYILHKMNRQYDTKFYYQLINKIKKNIPTAGIGADVIVGFPGETNELFKETYDFISDLPISYLHVFSFSERKGTASFEMKEKVEPKVKSERSEILRQMSMSKRQEYYKTFIDRNVQVLFESSKNNNILGGLTGEYIRVYAQTNQNLINQISDVIIKRVENEKCFGEILINQKKEERIAIQ